MKYILIIYISLSIYSQLANIIDPIDGSVNKKPSGTSYIKSRRQKWSGIGTVSMHVAG